MHTDKVTRICVHLCAGVAEVLAYGTAVVVEPLSKA